MPFQFLFRILNVSGLVQRGRRGLLRAGLDIVPVGGRAPECELIRRVMRETGLLLNSCEAYQILSLARATSAVEGDLAEVGVFRGGSARLMCEGKGDRTLHLFDTFEGLPAPTNADRGTSFKKGQFNETSLAAVQEHLAGYSNVHYYPGLFPSTAQSLVDRRFAFVHLDVDLYESTRSSLQFFYQRMSPRGIILLHDYYSSGVRKAIDEFMNDKPELVIVQPAGAHCFLSKAPDASGSPGVPLRLH